MMSLLFCVWLTGGAVAAGWIQHADHYGAAFAAYGKCYFAAASIMTLGVLLYFLRLDLPAAIFGCAGYLPTLILLLKAINTAEENGWAGQTEYSIARTAASVWRSGMMWDFVPLLLLLLLTLTRFFSYDASVRRAEKRAERARAENAPAPSILADDAGFGRQHSTASAPSCQQSEKDDRFRTR